MSETITIQCSSCGNTAKFLYTAANVIKTVKSGWGSYGAALYCPKCTRAWLERNDKPMAGGNNTIRVIDNWAQRTSRPRTLSFDLNGGDTKVWEQFEHDGDVTMYTLEVAWMRSENEIRIPAGDVIMLGNLYREIKEQDIKDPFLNFYGKQKLRTGENIWEALKKQRPLKPIGKTDEFRDIHTVCPNCENSGLANPFARSPQGFKYCPECGQALDWEERGI